MSAKADLWGDIEVVEGQTPLSILREQAALLGTKTQNLVKARVRTYGGSDASFIRHSFRLVVPALDAYEYELFAIMHRPIDLYPVHLEREEQLESEDKFKAWLLQKLSSSETKKILSNLIAQARS